MLYGVITLFEPVAVGPVLFEPLRKLLLMQLCLAWFLAPTSAGYIFVALPFLKEESVSRDKRN